MLLDLLIIAQHHRRADDPARRPCTSASRSSSRRSRRCCWSRRSSGSASTSRVTRLILLQRRRRRASSSAFGKFVVGGNIVVGIVVFLILVVIQFVVITNGAGRVAEVAARFTLDAMPGKQMAIDADLNAGLITDDAGPHAPLEIEREADFYGAMDGASKFVKGDAIAAVRDHRRSTSSAASSSASLQQAHAASATAMHTYTLLTVGDGLVAQIPALLISIATGILVTRSAARTRTSARTSPPSSSASRRRRWLAGVVVCAYRPRCPACRSCPFVFVGGLMACSAGRSARQADETAAAAAAPPCRRTQADNAGRPARPAGARSTRSSSRIGFGLVPLVDRRTGGALLRASALVRRQIASELGIVIAAGAHPRRGRARVARVRGEGPRHRGRAGRDDSRPPPRDEPRRRGRQACRAFPPSSPRSACPRVDPRGRTHAEAEALGYTVVDGESVIVTHLTETDPPPRRRAAHAAGDAQAARRAEKEINGGRRDRPRQALGRRDSAALQLLLREGVSIRDLGTILEAVGDRAAITRDPRSWRRQRARRSAAPSPRGISTLPRRFVSSR